MLASLNESEAQDPETDEHLQKVFDSDMVLFISPHIGKSWKKLGRCLGLTEAEIENIEADNVKDQEEQGVQMLNKWMKENGSNATVGTFIIAAKKAQRNDLAERV
jgi:pyrroloquinoline quinone (PQQ) biosynthesis protein C